MKILLGVTGSVAAYKAADLASALTRQGHNVTCVLTKGGSNFITPLTLMSLSKNKVYVDEDFFGSPNPDKIVHVDLARDNELILIAPASADFMAKVCAGIGNDILSSTLLACDPRKVILAPAMNTRMYENPVTQRNMDTLKEFGYRFISPKDALLACKEKGTGALADIDTFIETIKNIKRN